MPPDRFRKLYRSQDQFVDPQLLCADMDLDPAKNFKVILDPYSFTSIMVIKEESIGIP
jgi:hypothetical protein